MCAQRAFSFKGALANVGLEEMSHACWGVETIAGALAHLQDQLPGWEVNLSEVRSRALPDRFPQEKQTRFNCCVLIAGHERFTHTLVT